MSANFAKFIFFEKLNYGTHLMVIYGAQVNRKWTGSKPEVGPNFNARDLQAQGACALRFLTSKVPINSSNFLAICPSFFQIFCRSSYFTISYLKLIFVLIVTDYRRRAFSNHLFGIPSIFEINYNLWNEPVTLICSDVDIWRTTPPSTWLMDDPLPAWCGSSLVS